MTRLEAGFIDHVEPESDQCKAQDHIAGLGVGVQPGHHEVPGGQHDVIVEKGIPETASGRSGTRIFIPEASLHEQDRKECL